MHSADLCSSWILLARGLQPYAAAEKAPSDAVNDVAVDDEAVTDEAVNDEAVGLGIVPEMALYDGAEVEGVWLGCWKAFLRL